MYKSIWIILTVKIVIDNPVFRHPPAVGFIIQNSPKSLQTGPGFLDCLEEKKKNKTKKKPCLTIKYMVLFPLQSPTYVGKDFPDVPTDVDRDVKNNLL